jgi:hypothetical protein
VFIRAVLQKLETSAGAVEQLRMNTNIFSVKLYLAS